jgi:hypothetical protein
MAMTPGIIRNKDFREELLEVFIEDIPFYCPYFCIIFMK